MYKAMRTLICALTLQLVASCGHNSVDTKGINNLAEDFSAAWNQHNAEAVADLWTSDGDFLSPWTQTELIKGREVIKKYFSDEYQNTMKNSKIKLAIDKVRMIDPETAFTETDFTISGMTIAGVQAEPFNDHAIFILVKQDGKWKIQIARPY